ncbi:MAG: alternative ribosome rescue aminoacyl-tRNA hydrolase ArfB [Pseudomonadota bacterium]
MTVVHSLGQTLLRAYLPGVGKTTNCRSMVCVRDILDPHEKPWSKWILVLPLPVTDDVIIPAADLAWKAVQSSSPGGQNVNKVSSKIVLRLDLDGTQALADDVKMRLRAIARRRLDAEGWLVVVSQRTRDQTRNLDDARDRLRRLILQALEQPRERRPTRPTRSSKCRRMMVKRRTGAKKRERGGIALSDEE